jgi:hypothetical protein
MPTKGQRSSQNPWQVSVLNRACSRKKEGGRYYGQNTVSFSKYKKYYWNVFDCFSFLKSWPCGCVLSLFIYLLGGRVGAKKNVGS